MDIISLIQNKSGYQKQSARTWEGPCPKCGGTKRCIIWVHDNIFKCRECEFKGGLVQWLKIVEGYSCKEAHAAADVDCDNTSCPVYGKCHGSTAKPRSSRDTVTVPSVSKKENQTILPRTPDEIWQQRALKLVEESHQRLLEMYQNGEPCPDTIAAWLMARGIPMAAVVKNRLGWLAGDNGKNCIYRPRSTWGLPEKLKDGKPVKLWIPRGVIIPTFVGERIDRIRIRRPNEDLDSTGPKEPLKYLAIEGSGTHVVSLNPSALAQMPIESDLDAILVDHVAGDLVGAIPLTTCGVMPNGTTAEICRNAAVVLVALDYDTAKVNPSSGKPERAGEKAWRCKWQPQYPNAERWPVPVGKDPGEAYQQGVDLRSWVLAGLPVSLHPPVTKVATTPTPVPPAAEVHEDQPVQMRIIDDREVYFPRTPDQWRQLVADKKITYGPKETAVMASATCPLPPVDVLLDIKSIFPGIYIEAIIPASQRRQYHENHHHRQDNHHQRT